MDDKRLIEKQEYLYLARGDIRSVYRKLYEYEQISDSPKNCASIDRVLDILDNFKRNAEGTLQGRFLDGSVTAVYALSREIESLRGE